MGELSWKGHFLRLLIIGFMMYWGECTNVLILMAESLKCIPTIRTVEYLRELTEMGHITTIHMMFADVPCVSLHQYQKRYENTIYVEIWSLELLMADVLNKSSIVKTNKLHYEHSEVKIINMI